MNMHSRPTVIAAIALAACTWLFACVRNPATGGLELNLVSESQEIEVGKQAAEEVAQTIGVYKDEKIEKYVERIGQGLAQRTTRKNLPWQFHVVDDPTVNAFALPGGPVFVTRGILAHLNSEAELAAVLGHECGHIAARHSVTQMSKAQVAQLGLGIGAILSPTLRSVSQIAGAGLSVLFLKFSRDDENQADQLGFGYFVDDGYDGRAMADVFGTLSRVGASSGGGRLPGWLSTHPDPEDRSKTVEERLAKLHRDFSGAKREREAYLALLDGIPFGQDPRQGYFKGNLFLHPGLKFQLSFPDGWKTANEPQAVVGISPKEDAIVQLAPAGDVSPEQAAEKFFSQRGVRQGPPGVSGVHGSPAVSSYFAAQTERGEVGGLVTFLRQGGQTLAILGYTVPDRLGTYDRAFRSTTSSFAELTDPEALAAQPARLRLVRVDSDLSVEEFNARHPSSVPTEVVALINGADKGGRIHAGLAKRIVGGVKSAKGGPGAAQ